MSRRRSAALPWMALAVALAGCASEHEVRQDQAPLPFTALIDRVEVVPVSPDALALATTPAMFEDVEELTRRTAEALDAAGIFEVVGTRDSLETPADIVVRLRIENYDFGAGDVSGAGAIFTTLAWLFAGPASWWIDNRVYRESDVRVTVELHHASSLPSPDARPIDDPAYDLSGMSLDFFERAEVLNWLLSIVVPPWLDPGDPETAGASLARHVPEFFARTSAVNLLLNFPPTYFRSVGSFLALDEEAGHLVIVSREALVRLEIRAGGGAPRVLEEDALDLLSAERPAKEPIRRWLARRLTGLALEPSDRYYRIALEDDELERVRVRAVLRESGAAPAWTVVRRGR